MSYLTDTRVVALEASVAAIAETADLSVVAVNSNSDLPSPSGGVITLADSTVYLISGNITLPDNERIVTGLDTVLLGYNRSRDTITGNVADALITIPTSVNSFKATNIQFTQNNAGGTLIATADSTASRIEIKDVRMVANGGDIGTMGGNSISFRRCSFAGFASGITFSGTGNNSIIIDGAAFIQADGSGGDACLDLNSSTWNVLRFENATISVATSGFGLSGAASNANFADADGRGTVSGVRFIGDGTPLENITINDLQWQFSKNNGVGESVALGSYSMSGNSTVTTINTVDTYEIIAGTTTADEERRYEMTDNNEITYRGLDPSFSQIFVTLSAFKSGSAKSYEFAIFVNGSQVGAAISRELNNVTGALALTATAELETDDVIDVRAQNTVDTDDFTAETLVVTVRGTF